MAVARLRAEPARMADAQALLARWRERNGDTAADAYRQEWARLMAAGVDVLEGAVCGDDDHAAVLRSVSPLSVLITQRERGELLRRVRQGR